MRVIDEGVYPMQDRRALLLGLLLGALPLTSCAHPSAPGDTSQGVLIRTGMSDAEVVQRLGPPGMVSEQPRTHVQVPTPSGLAFREQHRYTYYYPGPAPGMALRITFEDGVVVDKRQGVR